MKYIYPAIFEKDEKSYYIFFPDLKNCFTQGDDVEDGMKMAEDVLCLNLYDMEVEGLPIPEASDIKSLELNDNQFATLISCDTMEYRNYYNSKAVKRTVSIPGWMNDEAAKKGINFSELLQEALETELGAYRVSDSKKKYHV